MALGLVVGLDAPDPYLDGHRRPSGFKQHPYLQGLLEGGKLVGYGARAIPLGGYYAMPERVVDGALFVGDSAGFLNAQRLKGIHLGMKSGMLAAETIYEGLVAGDLGAVRLRAFDERFRASWAHAELWGGRNFHQGFDGGLYAGDVLHRRADAHRRLGALSGRADGGRPQARAQGGRLPRAATCPSRRPRSTTA